MLFDPKFETVQYVVYILHSTLWKYEHIPFIALDLCFSSRPLPTVCLSHPLCAHSQFHKTKEGTGQVGGKGNDNGQIFFPLKFEFWNFTPTQRRLEGQGTEEGGLFVDPLTLLLNRQTDTFWMKCYRKIAQDVALKTEYDKNAIF